MIFFDWQHSVLAEHVASELEGAAKLGTVVIGINLIIQHVDVAVKWWGDMDTELEAIEAKIARLESQDLSVLYLPYRLFNNAAQGLGQIWSSNSSFNMENRPSDQQMDVGSIRASIKIIKSSIKQRKEDFREYKNEVKNLQVRYPPALTH
ncbi:hypothetical protein GALMADRAFT_596137 [Galerina marginata CBS 339.88]|uniref:Uncharacterized protein n=1 Tax=Galerina marginata (strain CBS 339.88) TaxID=685588 RepID=A0A067T4Q4_GALM3|nr:hypothetical protein GALMADRAFT_596137 [Galerina marginata CBS 339.88]